jgi:NADH:ubiquinone oxidoreductase subunit 6 (subunit J)
VKNDVKAFLAAAIFLTLVFSVVAVDLRPALSGQGQPTVNTFAPWQGEASNPENPRGIAEFMFGPYALPFEVLSVVLLVALVGALVLAKPEHTEAEDQP